MDLSSSLSFDCTTSKGNKCPNCGVYLKETNLPEYCLFCNNIKGELENLESRVYYKQTSIWDHWSCFCDPIEEEGSPTKIQKIETIRQFDEEYDDDYADEWYNVQVKKAKSEKYVLKRYMEGQLEMKTYHRSATVCWMHALVKTSFTRVSDETFFLAVNLLDRILNVFSLSLHQIQYFALVALSVATKFEEIYCIGIDDMVQHLDDNKCSKRYVKEKR